MKVYTYNRQFALGQRGQPMLNIEDFLSVKAAAAELGIEPNAMYVRIHRGTVKVHKVSGHTPIIHKDEVERLKAEMVA
jgi:hypothetical protein